jgi:hypothetical protein
MTIEWHFDRSATGLGTQERCASLELRVRQTHDAKRGWRRRNAALHCRDLIVGKRRACAKRLRKILGLTFWWRESGSADEPNRRNYLRFVSQRT